MTPGLQEICSPSATIHQKTSLSANCTSRPGADRAQDLTELRVLYAVIRRAVVGVVEEVEELRSELEIHPLENRERLRCIKVHILEGWPHQIISVRMSIAANRQVTHRQMRGIHLSV